jgi:hypothetical protein
MTEPLMTSKEKAELHFNRKQAQMAEAPLARSEYEQRAQAEREKTVRLRALRLARDAALLAPKPLGAT